MSLTTNLQLSTPARGSQVGVWDTDINGNSTLLDQMIGSGVATVGLTSITVTLTNTQLQNSVIRFTGAISTNIAVFLPASPILKPWYLENLTTGAFSVFLLNPAGTSAIGLPQGETIQGYYDGTTLRYINLGRVGEYLFIGSLITPVWISSSTVPPYLNCDGGSFSAVTYPALNTLLGGTTLPDLRGRTWASLNQGTGRITTAGSGINGEARLSSGGAQTVTLAQTNLPSANFALSATASGGAASLKMDVLVASGASNGQVPTGGSSQIPSSNTYGTAQGTLAVDVTQPTITGTAASGGSSTPFNNMPPAAIGGIILIRAG